MFNWEKKLMQSLLYTLTDPSRFSETKKSVVITGITVSIDGSIYFQSRCLPRRHLLLRLCRRGLLIYTYII